MVKGARYVNPNYIMLVGMVTNKQGGEEYEATLVNGQTVYLNVTQENSDQLAINKFLEIVDD